MIEDAAEGNFVVLIEVDEALCSGSLIGAKEGYPIIGTSYRQNFG